jgi:hypothetical protein
MVFSSSFLDYVIQRLCLGRSPIIMGEKVQYGLQNVSLKVE